jgi:putative transposase
MANRKTKRLVESPVGARRSRRYTAKEKSDILVEVDEGATHVEVAQRYGVHANTIGTWRKLRGKGRANGDPTGERALTPGSTKPHDSPSPVPEEHREKILELKEEHPEMGPAQLRNHLRRFHHISYSHKVIGKVLKQAGIPLEKRVKDDEEASVERFEMTRPNELWTMDCKSFYVHDLKVWVVDIIDDYSRLIVGHRLVRQQPSADDAIATLKGAISRRGKPERVLTDRGGEFHSWRGQSRFNRFLEDEGIEHSLARPHHPQTCGKIEAVHRTLEKELIGLVRFDSFTHAKREMASYFERYNFERTHMGIGGVTPADRYFGRVEKVHAEIDRRIPALDRGDCTRLPGERAIVLQLALVEGRLELWFAGKRVELC